MDRSFGSVVYKTSNNKILFLLVLHKNGGHWDIPKGHPSEGESPEETAEREVFEETGYHIRLVLGFHEHIEYVLPRGELKRVDFFLAEAIDRNMRHIIDPDEIVTTEWLEFDIAYERITYENSKAVLLKANDYLRDNHNLQPEANKL